MNRRIIGCFSFVTAVLFSLIVASTGLAQSQPFQASVTPDIAVHDRNTMIEGLTLSLWGENPQRALSLGIVNGSTGQSAGFSWGLLLNYADSYKGVHWAAVNYTQDSFLGWQSGFINYTDTRLKGVQTGWVNYARRFTGVQLGLVNFAETAEAGLQVGIVNVIRKNRWFSEFPDGVAPGMVLVNWRF